jgi:hypothetical protein
MLAPTVISKSPISKETGLQVINLTVDKKTAGEIWKVGTKYQLIDGFFVCTKARLAQRTNTGQTPGYGEEHEGVEDQRRNARIECDPGYIHVRTIGRAFDYSAFEAQWEVYGASQECKPEDKKHGDNAAVAVIYGTQAQEK